MTEPYRSDAQLEAWIAQTRRNQKRLAVGLGVAAVVAAAAWWFNGFVGKTLLFGIVVTAICGFWITAAHIADWRAQLAARLAARRQR